ncbi:MAG TPA: EAL domain-containing protein [Candidatus Polarisedimenticolaceae bacterium]|nr:EAL domain-containing protein [Candidatus Polarisedimenticolaceae bacterium]
MPTTTLDLHARPAFDAALPDLARLLGRIEAELARRGQLGLLSVTVLQRSGSPAHDGWEDYEITLRAISSFLTRFAGRRMRSSDLPLAPIVSGNTFIVLLAPPRDNRSMDGADVALVHGRLLAGLHAFLARRLPTSAQERFGVYVGRSIMRHDPAVGRERIVYRSLEQALADALSQQEQEGHRQAACLSRLLESGGVRSVYQPVVDLVSRRVVGYEALTRVPRRHFRTPDLLFKTAQQNGVLWALERLCRRRALEGLGGLDGEQLVFLNVEPESLLDPELRSAGFLCQLQQAQLAPGRVVLELTEHAAVQDFAALREVLGEFRALGFRLAMDDVGSGYAGLRAIAEIAPDYLKVDMSLVRDLHRHALKRELVATILRFSESTGIALVAEGVESREELEALARTGVRCAQGYLFARPSRAPQPPDWDTLALR